MSEKFVWDEDMELTPDDKMCGIQRLKKKPMQFRVGGLPASG
jgi:hypothetical protein